MGVLTNNYLPLPSSAEKAVAPHSSVLAWRVPGTAEPGGLPSMGSHRVGHDWSNLAAAAAVDNSEGKESACNAGDPGSIPRLGRSPGERDGNPLLYSSLENSMDRRAWQVTVHGSQRVGHNWATFTYLPRCCISKLPLQLKRWIRMSNFNFKMLPEDNQLPRTIEFYSNGLSFYYCTFFYWSSWKNCRILGLTGEKAMATHSSTLAWKVPWTEEPGLGLQSMGSLRVRHDWTTSHSLFTCMHWSRKRQPTPVFLTGESQGRRSLVGCHLWGHTESDTTEVT